ncbi:MAG: hypothetical protein ABFS56_10355 [Pseudomonadota bacterium]
MEYSTLYVALLPRHATKVTATDTVSIAGVEVEVANLKLKSVSLDDLMMDYRKNKSEYADGLGRILDKLTSSPGTEYSFNTFLSSVIQSI